MLALNALPHCPVMKNDLTYFPISMTVHSNPSHPDFVDKNVIKDEFIKMCIMREVEEFMSTMLLKKILLYRVVGS